MIPDKGIRIPQPAGEKGSEIDGTDRPVGDEDPCPDCRIRIFSKRKDLRRRYLLLISIQDCLKTTEIISRF